MQYLMLLSDEEAAQLSPDDPGFEALMAQYAAFDEMVKRRGVYRASGKLQPCASATTIRSRKGDTTYTDGPFAETKEQIGGFYLLECEDLEQALELGAMIPTAQTGSVEVRPLFG